MQPDKRPIRDINSPSTPTGRPSSYRPAYNPVNNSSNTSGGQGLPVYSKKRRFKTVFLSVLLIAAIAGTAGLWAKEKILGTGQVDQKRQDAEPTSTKKEAEAPQLKAIDRIAVAAQLNEIIKKYPQMQISVSLTDLKTNDRVHAGVTDVFRAASTTKLLTAALFLRQTENGVHNLDQTVGSGTARTQLKLLIEKSDNAAWDSFDSMLGRSSLDKYAVEVGMQEYSAATNRTNSTDIALLLEKLYKRELLNEENTKLLLSHMQVASEQQYIVSAVPEGVAVYHKAGYLTDRVHDAAIIDDGKRPFVLVIFSNVQSGQYNYQTGATMMREITSAALNAYKNL